MTVRRTTATIAFAAAIFGALGASVAQAVPIDPVNGPSKGCPIVHTDSNGNETVTFAKAGDRNGVLVCGSDGEWSFGRTAQGGNWQQHNNQAGIAQR